MALRLHLVGEDAEDEGCKQDSRVYKVIWRGADSVRDTRQPLSKGRRVE